MKYKIPTYTPKQAIIKMIGLLDAMHEQPTWTSGSLPDFIADIERVLARTPLTPSKAKSKAKPARNKKK